MARDRVAVFTTSGKRFYALINVILSHFSELRLQGEGERGSKTSTVTVIYDEARPDRLLPLVNTNLVSLFVDYLAAILAMLTMLYFHEEREDHHHNLLPRP